MGQAPDMFVVVQIVLLADRAVGILLVGPGEKLYHRYNGTIWLFFSQASFIMD